MNQQLAHGGDEAAVRGLVADTGDQVKAARQKWLDERRTGIGGSDAAAVVGLSPWRTPLEVYLDKIGELPDSAENEDMRRGTLLEPVVRQLYADATGRKVLIPDNIIRNVDYPWALVNLDGISIGPTGYQRGLECKTARNKAGWGEPGSADIPMVYLLQVQHGMAVAKLSVFDVAVFFGDFDFAIYEVEADAELIGLLMEREAAFWRMVKSRTVPDPVSVADVKLRWPRSLPLTYVTASPADLHSAAILMFVKRHIAALEAIEETAKAALQATIKDAESLTFMDETVATWKSAKGGTRFDAKRFQAEHPDLYAQYLTEAAGARRFLLKEKCQCLQSITIPLPSIPEGLYLPPQVPAVSSPSPANED